MQPPEALAETIAAAAGAAKRFVVAIAGPPGAGKSTLVEALQEAIETLTGKHSTAIVPMDGFHYDNAVLDMWGERPRKGAAFTFDVAGYEHILRRIREADAAVAVPVFDRTLDLARAGARLIEPRHRIILTEGNYLLLDEAPWDRLAACFDLTIYLDVPESVLERRLIARWLAYGLDPEAAALRARSNDLVNARHVRTQSRKGDITVTTEEAAAERAG
jgi:pantothenate kinase